VQPTPTESCWPSSTTIRQSRRRTFTRSDSNNSYYKPRRTISGGVFVGINSSPPWQGLGRSKMASPAAPMVRARSFAR
jgi:hypothetical protein